MDFSKYSPGEQAEVEKMIQQKQVCFAISFLRNLLKRRQIKDLTTMYSNLVERCFIECCHNFTSRELGPKEVLLGYKAYWCIG
jgi:mitochondrial import inner membrane translocase subunit TIM9